MRPSLVLATFAALAAICIISSANAEMNPDGMMKMIGGVAVNVLEGCIKGDPCEIFNKKCLKFMLGKTKDLQKGKMPDLMSLMSDAKKEGCESLMNIIMSSFMG